MGFTAATTPIAAATTPPQYYCPASCTEISVFPIQNSTWPMPWPGQGAMDPRPRSKAPLIQGTINLTRRQSNSPSIQLAVNPTRRQSNSPSIQLAVNPTRRQSTPLNRFEAGAPSKQSRRFGLTASWINGVLGRTAVDRRGHGSLKFQNFPYKNSLQQPSRLALSGCGGGGGRGSNRGGRGSKPPLNGGPLRVGDAISGSVTCPRHLLLVFYIS